MSTSVLVLHSDGSLSAIISWQDAIGLIVSEKVYMLAAYADRVIRSATESFPFPAVVVRKGRTKKRRRVQLTRRNILARDAYTCQYCGLRPRRSGGRPDIQKLTIDHVVPRAQSRDGWVRLPWSGNRVRVTSWMNVLTACESCNGHKANRTPAEAGMKMNRRPKLPNRVTVAWMSVMSYDIPDEWKEYLPADSPWRDYWTAELVS